MKMYYRTRTTYAGNHRVSALRSQCGVYHTEAGEGIMRQTCSGEQEGFQTPVVERQRANGSPVYFVESEKFAGRYYYLFEQNGAWVFSGDDKLLACYVAKVEAFRAPQPEQTYIAPILNGPWREIAVHVSDKEMAEIRESVRAAMPAEERRKLEKEEAFDRVWQEVREIERRTYVPGSAKRRALAS